MLHPHRSLLLPLLLCPAFLCQPAAAAQNPTAEAPCTPPGSELCLRQEYHLHLSDVFDVQFSFSPEYNQTLTVQPDGYVVLREAGRVQAAGKSVTELQAAVAQAYNGILSKPVVSIVLKDFFKPSFYASGEVGKPGRYELRSDVTLMQALSEAGGLLNERASKKQVVVFRPLGNGTYESHIIDVSSLLKPKGPNSITEDVRVQPGDIIYVPQNKASKIKPYLPNASMGAYLAPTTF